MSEPLVSVVIPTYQRAHLIERSVQSALRQTFTNIEVLVVSGSIDGARAVVDGLGDGRTRVIEIENRGPAHSRNVGIQHARGKYIALLDDDDEWTPEKLATQLQMIDRHGLEGDFLLSCRVLSKSGNDSHVWPKRLFQAGADFSEYLLDRPTPFQRIGVASGTLLFPRSLALRIPFPNDVVMEDFGWLLLCMSSDHVPFYQCPEPMFIYHLAPQSRNKIINWRLSLEWAKRYRPYMSGKAYSGLLASTTAWRAKRQGGYRAFAEIAHAMRQQGTPRVIHWVMIGSVALLPITLADNLRRWS
jgi:glycosyltransferase involved in cell wall biosynthesis